MVSKWFQPIWKTLVKMGSSSPIQETTTEDLDVVSTCSQIQRSSWKHHSMIRWILALWSQFERLSTKASYRKPEGLDGFIEKYVCIHINLGLLSPCLWFMPFKSSNRKKLRMVTAFPKASVALLGESCCNNQDFAKLPGTNQAQGGATCLQKLAAAFAKCWAPLRFYYLNQCTMW